jgi:hypothetical protein
MAPPSPRPREFPLRRPCTPEDLCIPWAVAEDGILRRPPSLRWCRGTAEVAGSSADKITAAVGSGRPNAQASFSPARGPPAHEGRSPSPRPLPPWTPAPPGPTSSSTASRHSPGSIHGTAAMLLPPPDHGEPSLEDFHIAPGGPAQRPPCRRSEGRGTSGGEGLWCVSEIGAVRVRAWWVCELEREIKVADGVNSICGSKYSIG